MKRGFSSIVAAGALLLLLVTVQNSDTKGRVVVHPAGAETIGGASSPMTLSAGNYLTLVSEKLFFSKNQEKLNSAFSAFSALIVRGCNVQL